MGARVQGVEQETEYAYRAVFELANGSARLADRIEDIPDAEVLSLGHSLEIIKDLGDADSVCKQYDLDDFNGTHAIGHVRMATEVRRGHLGRPPVLGLPVHRHRRCPLPTGS